MSLNFILQQNLTTDTTHNVSPFLVKTPFICEEPDSILYQYFIEPEKDTVQEKRTKAPLGQYDSLSWADLQNQLSINTVSRIGIKHFPHIGAIGFYKDKYTGLSMIAAPIHVKTTKYTAPVIDIVTNTSSVTITITPPEDVSYTCYKVIMRSGYFAYEYVTYETPVELPLPAVIGIYTIYAVGYNETTGICSFSSNVKILEITTGKTNWNPADLTVSMSLEDLQNVSLNTLKNQQLLHYNSVSNKWENFTSIITINVNNDSAPVLGALLNNTEYRCTNTALTTAPTFTIPAMGSTAAEFSCVIVYKSPGTTKPVITNSSGYNLRYSGQDVNEGVWVPVVNTVYRLSLTFDGLYLNVYVSGVV